MADTPYVPGRIAEPRVLGLYALAAATFLVGSRMAGWYDTNGRLLAAFIAVFGLAQLLAAMWSYERHDELATAIFGMWGAFWLAYGVLDMPFATPTPVLTAASPEIAFALIALAAITWMLMLAAAAESAASVLGLLLLAGAATVGAIADGLGIRGLRVATGWLFFVAGVIEWYTATALLLASSHGRDVLPVGTTLIVRTPPAASDVPRATPAARRIG
jgi:succinate-acetate transporter protein